MSDLQRTPLFEEHVKAEAKIIDFAGWEMPVQYAGIADEHFAVRNEVGIFDVSHMGEVFVDGKDATAFIQNLVVNDISGLEDTKIIYSPMCYDNGGVVDDLLIYKYNDEKYLIVVNASNIDKDYQWMVEHVGDFDVQLANESNAYGEVAIQGPKAEVVLQKLVNIDLSVIKYLYFTAEVKIGDIDCIVSRSGYTGEDGFEVYAKADQISSIWRQVLEAGKDQNIQPIGLGARDTLRFEAALPLYGNELSADITPLEAGLGFFVKTDIEADFIGKNALKAQREGGLTRRIVGFELLGKGIPRHGYAVLNTDGEVIGEVTTGYKLPAREVPLGLALIDLKYKELGTDIQIQIRKKVVPAKVVAKKFMDKQYKK